MSKVIVATGNSTGLPDQTGLEALTAADGGLVAPVTLYDPATGRIAVPDANGALPVSSAAASQVDGHSATIGATTGTAVTTNAVGTVQQYLRGLVTLIAAKIGVTLADGDNVTFGALAAAVWDGTAASVSHMSYQRYMATKLEAIRAAVTDATAVAITDLQKVGGTAFALVAKNVQGANGSLPVQAVKDSGRVSVRFYCAFTTTQAADTLINTFVRSDDGAATGTGLSSLTANAGKRLRIESITEQFAAGAAQTLTAITTVTARVNPGGAAVIGSQSQGVVLNSTSTTPSLPGNTPVICPIPDGWELPAGAGLGFSVSQLAWAAGQVTVVYVTVTGYEY